jgi:hypothetical protein
MNEFLIVPCKDETYARRFQQSSALASIGRILMGFVFRRLLRISIIAAVGVLRWRTVLIGVTLYVLFSVALWLYRCFKVWPTNQFTSSLDIRNTREYNDAKLLESAWKLPVAQLYQSTGGLCFQPREGWCGYASLNTVLRSVKGSRSPPLTMFDCV